MNKNHGIHCETEVPAPIESVWKAWTTEEGITSFFAPACHINLRVDGPYEIYFNPDAEPGMKGAEDIRLLAIEAPTMLSFTWSAPPHLPKVRKQRTHVLIRLRETAEKTTRVSLTNDGYGTGQEWKEAFKYFQRAWGEIVLPRLRYYFDHGPIDWENPPE